MSTGVKYTKEFLAEPRRLSFIPNITGNNIFPRRKNNTDTEASSYPYQLTMIKLQVAFSRILNP